MKDQMTQGRTRENFPRRCKELAQDSVTARHRAEEIEARMRVSRRPTQKDLDAVREYAMAHMGTELYEATLRIINAMEVLR